MKRLEEFAGKGMRSAAPLPRGTMPHPHRIEKGHGFRYGCPSCQAQLTESFEITQRAPELLARIGAQHRIELAVACRQAAEIDRIGGKRYFAASEPALVERPSRQAPQRTADMKL